MMLRCSIRDPQDQRRPLHRFWLGRGQDCRTQSEQDQVQVRRNSIQPNPILVRYWTSPHPYPHQIPIPIRHYLKPHYYHFQHHQKTPVQTMTKKLFSQHP